MWYRDHRAAEQFGVMERHEAKIILVGCRELLFGVLLRRAVQLR
jgi:hypothetical protein